ncbi:baseplate J/gp47 family protein [Paenibacillus profundus]|uniref:Baseplate J/gp47 family protein n=1 Tax=Paenibacillus profundus TaxID=1173085 RepID=A0ABS8YIE9_9BACL|nr:baseplate J/gp47 family protein [Paenibacillus profundus]MCE5171362.1 baseplate J/gp47 family protein [Paenibacillus profundus]
MADLDQGAWAVPRLEDIMERMLERVPGDVDKREGSIIYDALAPIAVELAQAYTELHVQNELSYADTSSGEYLERRTAEYGVKRKQATAARRKGLFYDAVGEPFDVPLRSRFSTAVHNYAVVERLSAGVFVLESEAKGSKGNEYYGSLMPVDYVDQLARAELADVIAPGEDEESDESLRRRFFEAVNEQPFGGNVADYKKKVTSITGVGGVKIFPVWKGGGTVKCTIISGSFDSPSAELVKEVQTLIDPEVNQGKGLGFAPIGHAVTIKGAASVGINVSTTLTLDAGVAVPQVKSDVEKVISDYLRTLRTAWKEEERTIVRVSQLEARILTIKGIADIADTKLNGMASNVELNAEEIPVLGTVTLNG